MTFPVEIFQAAMNNDILKLLIQISVLLITARLFGEFSQKIGQPAVLGEILAGIVLVLPCLEIYFLLFTVG